MSAPTSEVAMVLAYRIAVLTGCAWLVWHGWSPWWFLLAILTMPTFDDEKEKP